VPIQECPDSCPDGSAADSPWNSLGAYFPVRVHKAHSPALELALSAEYCREFQGPVWFEEYWDSFASGA